VTGFNHPRQPNATLTAINRPRRGNKRNVRQ
jgi:hypothetical protein